MSSLRLIRAKQLLQQTRNLLGQVQEDIRTKRFSSDDVRLQMYNDLVATAVNLFPEDTVLKRQMEGMPNIQNIFPAFATEYLIKFPQTVSERIEAYLTNLINRLEILLGEEPTQQLLDEWDFLFIADQKLRDVLRLDFIEAQKSSAVGAYKACGLLCGGLIEGMLLDIVQRPTIVIEQRLNEVARRLNLPHSGQTVDWDKVSMTSLIKISSEFGVVSGTALKFAEGARDVRDTIHPRAEVRQSRVTRDEASLLLELVKLIYNDLIARFGKG